MRNSKALRLVVNLFFLLAILVDVFLNYSKYFVGPEDVRCELGRVDSFGSKRSASNWFYLVESGERFSADSFNLSKSAPYAIWKNDDYIVNDQLHTICHVEVRRFVFFESNYVIYFGDYSYYENDLTLLVDAVSSIENRTYVHFAFFSFIYLVFFFVNLRD
ncbi:hypothetical protein [Rheinheimera sp.]|uniref:hypothetical protein n=1 Tax=Rheinheimera sp. TaxID=1869214 RepID=UPI0027345E54|nr:hypothetical protein [Rheinheimera sp.]MDP2713836.1 hypothetical protein [Rheinheimera sp.]